VGLLDQDFPSLATMPPRLAVAKLRAVGEAETADALEKAVATNTGRSAELLQIERSLLPKPNGARRVVIISGFGGIGKTTLAGETADWLTRTKMFTASCFISFAQGGDATSLLRALGRFLSIEDGSYDPRDVQAILATVCPRLKDRPSLIIVDNLESILPGGAAPLDETGLRQLWEVLLRLAEAGAGVLATSGDPVLGDQDLATSDQVKSLVLGGLSPDDASELAARILNRLQIDRARIPYAELSDLLAQLDYHPLAIQLTLPALKSLPIATIQTQFAALLPSFRTESETGQNASLSASLQYALRRLSAVQQALLPRLAPFVGGALEPDLLEITQMTSDQWSALGQELEQAGLLTQDFILDGMKARFQHFHPVLTPYLRGLSGPDDATLFERYTQYYCGLASHMRVGDRAHPERIRAIARLELANFLHALELLLPSGDVGLITATADAIITFLEYLGMWRTRDALRARVLATLRPANANTRGPLTWSVYWQEKSLGEQEIEKGHWQAASQQFQALLFAIESLPEGEELGPHSISHAITLQQLARALHAGGQIDQAAERWQQAWAIAEKLLRKTPNDQDLLRLRGTLLCDHGDIVRDQGQYAEAKQAYEAALQIAQQINHQRDQAIAHMQLATLALRQSDYAGAINQYQQAGQRFRELGEQAMEATVCHQMGVALAELALTIHGYHLATVGQPAATNLPNDEGEQQLLAEAENAYRESLKLRELLGDEVAAASTCHQLAILTERTGRYREAKGWYLQALKLFAKAAPNGRLQVACLANLAQLLNGAAWQGAKVRGAGAGDRRKASDRRRDVDALSHAGGAC
jgi:tetratricopeptide (TPR) repeat protein